jgi:hypothetical protein
MDHCRAFFLDCDGLEYRYETGHWYKVESHEVSPSAARPAGLKYVLAFFDPTNVCLVRDDNSHSLDIPSGQVPYDHWRRFARNELVPYSLIDIETLLDDFFADIDRHLPPQLRSG